MIVTRFTVMLQSILDHNVDSYDKLDNHGIWLPLLVPYISLVCSIPYTVYIFVPLMVGEGSSSSTRLVFFCHVLHIHTHICLPIFSKESKSIYGFKLKFFNRKTI